MSFYFINNLYEEDINITDLVSICDNLVNDKIVLDYFIILHNRDIDNNGELKKAHYHCLLNTYANRQNDILNDKFSKLPRAVSESVKSPLKACRYLTHKDNAEKYQYSDKDVITNNIDTYKKLIYKDNTKSTDVDLLLKKYCEHLDTLYSDFGKVEESDIISFWVKNNRVGYLIQHFNNIKQFTTSYKNYYEFENFNNLIEKQ